MPGLWPEFVTVVLGIDQVVAHVVLGASDVASVVGGMNMVLLVAFSIGKLAGWLLEISFVALNEKSPFLPTIKYKSLDYTVH